MARSPLAAGVNFSQRADLLGELLRGEAEARLDLRRRAWDGAFSRYLSTSWGAGEITAHAWRLRFGAQPALPSPALEHKATLSAAGVAGAMLLALDALAPGRYWLIAISEERIDI